MHGNIQNVAPEGSVRHFGTHDTSPQVPPGETAWTPARSNSHSLRYQVPSHAHAGIQSESHDEGRETQVPTLPGMHDRIRQDAPSGHPLAAGVHSVGSGGQPYGEHWQWHPPSDPQNPGISCMMHSLLHSPGSQRQMHRSETHSQLSWFSCPLEYWHAAASHGPPHSSPSDELAPPEPHEQTSTAIDNNVARCRFGTEHPFFPKHTPAAQSGNADPHSTETGRRARSGRDRFDPQNPGATLSRVRSEPGAEGGGEDGIRVPPAESTASRVVDAFMLALTVVWGVSPAPAGAPFECDPAHLVSSDPHMCCGEWRTVHADHTMDCVRLEFCNPIPCDPAYSDSCPWDWVCDGIASTCRAP